MSFLNAALLAALSLGILPILIHLLNRQRFKKIDFPTLRFLRELQRQKMRQVRIRQIILLALRTLAVLFLVLAVARPVLKSSAGILPGVEARTTAILIVDRSASMNAETPNGSRYREIQARAQEVLALLKDGDEAQIVWADDKPALYPEAASSNIRLLREAIVESKATDRGGDLVEALKQARIALGKSQNLHKEVYLFSDFSGSAWPEKLPDIALLPDDVRLFLLPADDSTPRNVGIVDATVTSRLITPGRPVELSFTARNSGDAAASDRLISVYLNNRRVAQTRITLGPGEIKSQRVKFVPDAAGDQVGSVRIEDADEFADDDQRSFVLKVPSQLRVAVVGNNGPARDLSALAMNPLADPGSFVQAKSFTPQEFESEDWSTYDAIFVVDAAGFGASFPSRLRSFVENGKGALIMPGPQVDIRAYNSWLPSIGLPTIGDVWQNADTPAKWSRLDLQHPLFEGLFEEKPADISPQISQMVRTSGGAATRIVSTTTDLACLVESKVGRGRALFLATSPDPTWSSLFRAGIFPPLMVSSAAYLSGIGTSGDQYQLTCGVASSITFPGTPGDERFELRDAESTTALAVESASSGFVVKLPAIDKPGEYWLWQGSRRLSALAVNIPTRESDLRLSPQESYQRILGGKITTLGTSGNVKNAIMEGRFGRELWKLCLILALLMLVLEMLIGRVGKRDVAVAT